MPHIKVLKSHMQLRVQDALVDRVGRFARMLVLARDERKQRVSFCGFDFEYQAGERELILIREGKKLFLKLSRSGPAALWNLESHAEGALEQMVGLQMSWKQKFDLEKFREEHVRRKNEKSGEAAPA